MKLRTGSFLFQTLDSISMQGSGDCPVLRPAAKKPTKSKVSANKSFFNIRTDRSSHAHTEYHKDICCTDFANANSVSMNKAYSKNSVSEDSAIQNSRNQFFKPWSVFINGHATVDNNKLDVGLKKMYLGLHKKVKKSIALSLMSIIDSSKNSKANSKENSILEIEQQPEKMATPQIISPKPTRASQLGKLLGVPSMVSITPCADLETAENDCFWNGLWCDAQSETLGSPEDQNIFRPKSGSAISRSFFTSKTFLGTPATSTSTSIPARLRFLSVPASQEELALENFTGKGKNLPRALKGLYKQIQDTSVRNVTKNIGTTLMSDKVSGMKGFKTAMTNLMRGPIKPTVESKCDIKPGFLSESPDTLTADKSRTSGSNVKREVSRKIDRRQTTLLPIDSSKWTKTPESVINTVPKKSPAKNLRILKSSPFSITSVQKNSDRDSPFRAVEAKGKLNQYCHKPTGSNFQPQQTKIPTEARVAQPKTVSNARIMIFNFEDPKSSMGGFAQRKPSKNFRIQTQQV